MRRIWHKSTLVIWEKDRLVFWCQGALLAFSSVDEVFNFLAERGQALKNLIPEFLGGAEVGGGIRTASRHHVYSGRGRCCDEITKALRGPRWERLRGWPGSALRTWWGAIAAVERLDYAQVAVATYHQGTLGGCPGGWCCVDRIGGRMRP